MNTRTCVKSALKLLKIKQFLKLKSACISSISRMDNLDFKTKLRAIDDIPGPRSLPLVGSLLELKQFGGKYDILDFRVFQDQLQAEFGDIVRWNLLNVKNVYLFDPELIKQVFKNEDKFPARPPVGPMVDLHKKLNISATLLTSTGEHWRKLRTASNPILAKPQTIHSYLPSQNNVANDWIDYMNKKYNENGAQVMDYKKFDQVLRLLALEYVSEVTFNQRLRCVDENLRLPYVDSLVETINEFFIRFGRLLYAAPFWKIYPTKDWVEFEKAGRYIYRIVREYIRQAQLKLDTEKTDENKKSVLVQYLERAEKYGLKMNDIVAVMGDLLIAGVDTAATAMYYILYELGKNIDIQQKLFQEIETVIGNHKNVTEEHISQMKYLKGVVKESMRLHSTIPANARILSEDIVLKDYLIPKGTQMILCNSFITKSEKYFKNPLKFDPNRWERSEKGFEEIHPYSTVSFGHGARMCIGRRLAEQEIYLTVIKLIQNYKIVYEGKTPGMVIGLVATPDIPLDINLIKRNLN